MDFETSTFTPSGILSVVNLHLLHFPTQCWKLGSKYLNTGDYGGHLIQTTTLG